MRRMVLIGASFFLVSVFALFGLHRRAEAPAVPADPGAGVPVGSQTATLFVGENALSVEVVANSEELMRGLGGRASLVPNAGMLFVFTNADRHGIWMKDMRFPIDIVWLDSASDGACKENLGGNQTCLVVVDIKRNTTPESYPQVFYPKSKALYVLELNAGAAQVNGLRIGSVMR